MSLLHVSAPVKKVGNSLAIFIPAEKARQARLREGDVVEADIEPRTRELLGLCPELGPWTVEDKRWGWPDGEPA